MDRATKDIQQNIEETRQEMLETQAALTEKLELLEERVRQTVVGATATVDEIVENVKDTVDETVSAVKEAVSEAHTTVEEVVEKVRDTVDEKITTFKQSLDLSHQMQERPWLMVGMAVFAGSLLGKVGGRRTTPSSDWRNATATDVTTDEDGAAS